MPSWPRRLRGRTDRPGNRLSDELDAAIPNANRRDVRRRHILEPHRLIFGPQTSLRPKVGHVYGVCPQKEMVGIYTTSFITAMTNVQTLGDRAVLDYPGQSMGEVFPAFDGNAPIAPLVQVAPPYQTT